MKLKLKAGTTSKVIRVFAQDATSSSGAGLTALAHNSSGLTAYYIREGAAAGAQIPLVAQSAVGTWTNSTTNYGFGPVDATNFPGVYELSLPNAAVAAGAASVVVMLKGATNMVPILVEIELDALDYQDSVRAGLTALPNAAAGANGGLPTGDGSGRVAVQSGTGTGQISLSSGQVSVGTIASGAITAASIAADAIDADALAADVTAELQSGLATTSALTTVGNNVSTLLTRIPGTVAAQSGDAYARLGAPANASIAADIAAVSTGGVSAEDIAAAVLAAEVATGLPLAEILNNIAGIGYGDGTQNTTTGVHTLETPDGRTITLTVSGTTTKTRTTEIA